MKAYGYVAYTDDGRRRAGSVVAETEAHAAEQLRAQGLYVSDLSDRGAARGGFAKARRGRLSAELQSVLVRQLAVLLGAGLPAEAALDAVRNSGAGGAIEGVAARAKAALLDGAPLSEALEHSGAGFAPYTAAAIRAGESSGDVAEVMAGLADHLESRGTEKAQIGAALIYPGFVAAVSLLVCGILMTTVAPEIVAMFALSDRPLPQITQVVLAVSDWIGAFWPWLAAGAGGVAALWAASHRVDALRDLRHTLVLRLPLAGRLMRLDAAVQYLRTLALVLGSRQTVLVATSSAADVLDVRAHRAEAEEVQGALRSGAPLSQALERLSIVPPVARQLVAAGEASARMAAMTDRAATLVEGGLVTERRRIAALLEPLLMIVVGGVVLVIVLAVLLPIFDLQAVVAG